MIEKKTEDEGQVSETQRLDAQTDPDGTPADIEVIPEGDASSSQTASAIPQRDGSSEQAKTTDADSAKQRRDES